MKRKPLLAALAIALLLVAVQSTLAYFTSKDNKENVFTMGNVDIDLTEPSWDETEEHVFYPGAEYDKDPTVENKGNMDAWVRVHVTLSDYGAVSLDKPKDYDFSEMFVGIDSEKWTKAGDPVIENDAITYVYLYNKALSAGESTGALFTKVKVPTFITEKTSSVAGKELSITVSANAIQKEGFEDPKEAFEAFDEQKEH